MADRKPTSRSRFSAGTASAYVVLTAPILGRRCSLCPSDVSAWCAGIGFEKSAARCDLCGCAGHRAAPDRFRGCVCKRSSGASRWASAKERRNQHY